MSALDPQLFEMVKQRFDNLDEGIAGLHTKLETHVAKDETYWKLVDQQQTEMGVMKRMFWAVIGILSTLGTSLTAWFTSK